MGTTTAWLGYLRTRGSTLHTEVDYRLGFLEDDKKRETGPNVTAPASYGEGEGHEINPALRRDTGDLLRRILFYVNDYVLGCFV
jgi:hypothetical protein